MKPALPGNDSVPHGACLNENESGSNVNLEGLVYLAQPLGVRTLMPATRPMGWYGRWADGLCCWAICAEIQTD